MPPPKKLLLEDGEEEGQLEITINEDFAKRFEHNKRREELHRLQERNPMLAAKLERQAMRETIREQRAAAGPSHQDGGDDEADGDDSDDESSSVTDGDLPDDTNQLLETIVKIRRHDPSVYDKDATFFPEPASDSEGGQPARGSRRKAKPVFLRDMVAKEALEGGDGSSDGSGSGSDGDGAGPHSPTYIEEQRQLKKAFWEAVEEVEEGAGDGEFGGMTRKQRAAAQESRPEAAEQLAAEVFSAADRNESFLKDFLLNQRWKEEGDQAGLGESEDEGPGDYIMTGLGRAGDLPSGAAQSLALHDEDDEGFDEREAHFEHAYNFRFEEPGSSKVATFPRQIEGSVRRPDERRKAQRQAKAERQAARARQGEEEVKRLKNLKMAEIKDRLGKVQEVAGTHAPDAQLLDKLLEGDWDPDAYDKLMDSAFDDDYYEADEDPVDIFDRDAELSDEAREASPEGDDGLSALIKQRAGSGKGASASRGEAAEEEATQADEAARKRADVSRLVEEYYGLDYEDNIDGLKTRFRYRQVPAKTFGLSVEDILGMSDRELNQIVGLKMLAPYREDNVRPNYKALQQLKGEQGGSWQRGGQRKHGKAAGGEGKEEKPWHQKWKGKGKQPAVVVEYEGQGQAQEPGAQPAKQRREAQQQRGADAAGTQQQGKRQKRTHEGQGAPAAEGDRDGGRQQQRQQRQEGGGKRNGAEEASEAASKRSRLESYGKLTLGKKKGGAERRQQDGQRGEAGGSKQPKQKQKQEPPASSLPEGLTSAQRKNAKRAMKRAQRRGGSEAQPAAAAGS